MPNPGNPMPPGRKKQRDKLVRSLDELHRTALNYRNDAPVKKKRPKKRKQYPGSGVDIPNSDEFGDVKRPMI